MEIDKKPVWHRRKLVMLSVWTALAVLTFAANLIFLVRLRSRPLQEFNHRTGTLLRGQCSKMSLYNTLYHIAINVASTLLHFGSTQFMHALLSPTRSSVDKAHENFRWLDIGVSSWRNFKAASPIKKMLWISLVISSLPLHFLYNSAILPTLASSSYTWAVVTPEFVNGAPYNISATVSGFRSMLNETITVVPDWNHVTDWTHPPTTATRRISQSFDEVMVGGTLADFQAAEPFNNERILEYIQGSVSKHNSSGGSGGFLRTKKLDCVQKYQRMVGNMSNVVLVSSSKPPSNSSVLWYGAAGLHDGADMSSQWLTRQSNNFSVPQFGVDRLPGDTDEEKYRNPDQAMSHWNVGGFVIDYCLTSQVDLNDKCAISFSQDFLTTVTVAIGVKLMLFIITLVMLALQDEDEFPLMMLGDAVQSFLKRNDKYTKGLGDASKSDIMKCHHWRWEIARKEGVRPLRWKKIKVRWSDAVSWSLFAWTAAIFLINFVIALVLLVVALVGLNKRGTSISFASLVRLGKGLDDAVLVRGKTINLPTGPEYHTFIVNVLFANYWQLFVSVISTLCNTVFIRLTIGREWQSSFGREDPKFLRVSYPLGQQRSGYFIGMPWKYGTVFMVLQVSLSWAISQAVYVLKIDAFFYDREWDRQSSISACGYGPIYLVTACTLAGILLIAYCGYLFTGTYSSDLPVVSTCSAAISAACHPPDNDQDRLAWKKPLR